MAQELDGHWGRRRVWEKQPDPRYNLANQERLTAEGNMSINEMFMYLKSFWEDSRPEVRMVKHNDSHTFEGDMGYIVYALTSKVPMENDAKPRFHRESPDISIFRQSFRCILKFSAVHRDPDTADQILEHFEKFMIEASPWLMSQGIQNIFYGGRLADDADHRIGQDVSVRAVQYTVLEQMLLVYRTERLKEIFGRMEVLAGELRNPLPATPPSDIALWHQREGATPNIIWPYEPEA